MEEAFHEAEFQVINQVKDFFQDMSKEDQDAMEDYMQVCAISKSQFLIVRIWDLPMRM
jgi:hypothetical protein